MGEFRRARARGRGSAERFSLKRSSMTDAIVKLKAQGRRRRGVVTYEGVQASGFEANPQQLNQKMAKRIKELEGEVATPREPILQRCRLL